METHNSYKWQLLSLLTIKTKLLLHFLIQNVSTVFRKQYLFCVSEKLSFLFQSIRVLSKTLSVSGSVGLNGLLIIVLKSHSNFESRKFQIVKSLNAIFDDIINHLALISVAQPVCKSIQTKYIGF